MDFNDSFAKATAKAAARATLTAFLPFGATVWDAAEKAQKAVDSAATKGMEDLKAELAKQELRGQFEHQQARIAQELAIAQRIANAEEVEIEEYYDGSGKGNAGLGIDMNAKTAHLGVGAEGRRVTKRIYRFKGLLPGVAEAVEQVIEQGE